MGKEKTTLWVLALTLLGLGAGFYLLWKDPALSMQPVGAALVFVSTIAAAVAALIHWCCCAQRGTREPRPTQSGGPKAKKLLHNNADVGETRARRRRYVANSNQEQVVVTFISEANNMALETDGVTIERQRQYEQIRPNMTDTWFMAVDAAGDIIACPIKSGPCIVIEATDRGNRVTVTGIETKVELPSRIVLFLEFQVKDGPPTYGVFSVDRTELKA